MSISNSLLWWVVAIVILSFCLRPLDGGGVGGGEGRGNTSRTTYPNSSSSPRKNQSVYIKLIEYLKKDYQPLAMPVCQPGQVLRVQLDAWLYQLYDLEEVSQMLTIDFWLQMTWRDCSLTWDPKQFNYIQEITLPASAIWHPDIINYESLHGNFEEGLFLFGVSTARLRHDGMIQLGAQLLLKTFCRFHVENFPFDTQICNITFSSWNKDASIFLLTSRDVDDNEARGSSGRRGVNYARMGHSFKTAGNGEWRVVAFPSSNRLARFRVDAEEKVEREYSEVQFQLVLQRKPGYVKIYLVFPCLLLVWITSLVFVLPVECGEKVSLVITTTLSLVVFLLLVAENIPKSSDGVPILAVFYGLSIGLVSLAVVMTTLVLNIGLKPVSIAMPRMLHRLLRHRGAMILFFRYNESHSSHKWMSVRRRRESTEKYKSGKGTTTTRQKNGRGEDSLLEEREKHHMAHDPSTTAAAVTVEGSHGHQACQVGQCQPNDWRLLAVLMDRLFLVLYVSLALALTLYISLQEGKGFRNH